MRLLKYEPDGKLVLETFDPIENTPLEPYAVLSHTWGNEQDEVTYQDILDGTASSKPGFSKVEFCGREAAREGYKYFWVDTCCIDKSNSTELQEAINSMFRWYQESARCYVYLTDVKLDRESDDGYWERSFRASRWFTRGWTLQELIAPSTVDFFSSEGRWLGDKRKLRQEISEITNVDLEALQGKPLHLFKQEERWSWSNGRRTKREEDRIYCLFGIFGVHMPLIYGEGYDSARRRIEQTLDGQLNLTTRSGEGSRKKTVFVAVMGLTGVGKSTFISHCTNGAAKGSGRLDSCTQEVHEYSCTYFKDIDVRLIDTPGFDDSERDDTSVLTDVSKWLGEKYKQHILLHGVIYLQRITDIRMQMSSKRSLRALRNVCGTDALKNVYLATTMWEKLATEAEGIEREGLLLEPKYWGDMAKKGCKIHRLQNDRVSALQLVRCVVDGSRPVVLQIQREMVDEAKSFDETAAGIELKSEIMRERKKFQAEKEEMLRELEEKRVWREETAKKIDNLSEQVRKRDADIANLQATFANAGKEITRELMQEKEKYELEKQAFVKEIELRRALDAEKQSWAEETEDALEELEDELKQKDQQIQAMRFNLDQNAATNADLAQAKKALTEQQERSKGRIERRDNIIASTKKAIKELKEEKKELNELLRTWKERYRKEVQRGDDYKEKYYNAKAKVSERDQLLLRLRTPRLPRHN